jgi:iron complex transport system ATP-binding protein
MSILKINDLSADLGSFKVLDNISLSVNPGLNVIIGANGSGKTSLLRVIAGLLTATNGQILFGQNDLLLMKQSDRANIISYLAQYPKVHWPLLVENLVTLARSNVRESRQQSKSVIEQAMADCNVLQFAKRRMDQLSGGERARVLLARALAVQAGLLLVDEPTAALDPAQQLSMMEILAATGDTGKTVLCVMHDIPLAARFATNLVLLDNGKITAIGNPEEVLTSKQCETAFNLAFAANGHLVL